VIAGATGFPETVRGDDLHVPTSPPPFDAILLLSFGGPDGPEDVMPFLENVTRGRGIPRERLERVAGQYMLFGGRSPINDECRHLLAALEDELAARGPDLPVYWGNRNWHPMLAETLGQMADEGIRRAVAVATSAYSSYSACRQYLEDIEAARKAVGENAPIVEKLAPYWNHEGFLGTMIEHTRLAFDALEAIEGVDGRDDKGPRFVFTAHSLPLAMAENCDYVAELREASAIVAAAVAPEVPWDLVWQSRSGPPAQPWLEPDVCAHLRKLHDEGSDRVVMVPIGFVADHMEVKYDLDTAARAVAEELDMIVARAACVGAAPRFVAGLRDLLAGHIEGTPVATLGTRGPRPSPCLPDCCNDSRARRPAH
jgi:protoporphyrin/coproporphyrin ferrochelatase